MACGDFSLDALLEVPCLKYLISKALGYAIVAGSIGVKLPQVFNIVKAGNVDGLSPTSILLEMASLVLSFAYYLGKGYPFSTWGENFFLTVQHSIITCLYIHHTSGLFSRTANTTLVPLIAMFVFFYQRAVPDIPLPDAACSVLGKSGGCVLTCEELAGGLPILIGLFARLPQIAQNMRQGHTGQLSIITYALNVAGSGARAFTVLQELNDKIALTSALSSCVQNIILVAQILLLGGAKAAAKGKAAAKPASKAKAKKAD